MSTVEKLIKELCPDGVSYVAIGDIADCFAGATPSTQRVEYWTNGTIPWMSSGEVNKKLITQTDKLITQEAFDSCSTRMIPKDSVVIALAGQGKTRGLVARTRIELCTNQSLCSLVPKGPVSSDFLYYYLSSQYVQLRSASSGDGTRGGLNLQIIKSYLVPAPPVEVQHEIVQILESFSQLEAELEAELEARKKQYEFYRNQLLTFPKQGGVRWVPMGEVVTVARPPKVISRNDYQEIGNYPIIDQGQTRIAGWTSDSESLLPVAEYVLFGDHTRTTKFVDHEFAQGADGLQILKAKDGILPKFLFYTLQNLEIPNRGYNRHWSIVKPMKVPVPTIESQQEIIDILDKFYALVTDISSGLPAELNARRKQYEYYRDKLLAFKELGE